MKRARKSRVIFRFHPSYNPNARFRPAGGAINRYADSPTRVKYIIHTAAPIIRVRCITFLRALASFLPFLSSSASLNIPKRTAAKTYRFGNGTSGTGTSKNAHSLGHPSFTLNSNNCPAGTVSRTRWLCAVYTPGPIPSPPFSNVAIQCFLIASATPCCARRKGIG